MGSPQTGPGAESRYLKPTFKSERFSVGIWGAVSLYKELDLVVVLRGQRMSSHRYIY